MLSLMKLKVLKCTLKNKTDIEVKTDISSNFLRNDDLNDHVEERLDDVYQEKKMLPKLN